MSVVRIEVRDHDCDPHEHSLVDKAQRYLEAPLQGAEELQVYWLQSALPIPAADLALWSQRVFADPILQKVYLDNADMTSRHQQPSFAVEVRFLPGVTDNIGRSATEALWLLSPWAKEKKVKVFSGKIFYLYGTMGLGIAESIAQELLGNQLIQSIQVWPWQEYQSLNRFQDQIVPAVVLSGVPQAEAVDLALDDRSLERLSKEKFWALSLAELQTIRDYYAQPATLEARTKAGLPAQPMDIEMEVLAQTWSEHCKHKIFNAEIDYTEDAKEKPVASPDLGSFTVKSIFKEYIRGATKNIQEQRRLPWLVSIFTDNAGVVRFDEKIDVCIKVETHNSPSALDPYGGALTGIVGVNRDILGCGMGARPIANTDVFCFSSPEWPAPGDERDLPNGLKHPRRIFDGVHLGVEDGGNKSGIPTVNGAFAFHRDFAGKPLVFCGTIGVMPQALPDGRSGAGKFAQPGDRVVMAGGRIGKDGIHGATFSSMELSAGAPATVVQIGDPITQKRLADFLLEARDLGLYSAVTDNGAGGLSSSVGEMAQFTGGAKLDLALAPTKYPGLQPYELFVSESQERMTFAVPAASWPAFQSLAQRRGVEVSNLGEFTSDGLLKIFYQDALVAQLEMEFLHNGLPPMVLKAKWQGAVAEVQWSKAPDQRIVKPEELNSRQFLEEVLYALLARWNIRSKESWVRRYDHEVQAATIGKPFVGKNSRGPGNSGVIWLAPHGGEASNGVAVGCGLQPKLSRFDAYIMAQHALDEAVRNVVASGADPDQLALTDNFCWPDPIPSEKNPDATHKLAQLVRAAKGLKDLAEIYGAPFVSGKDSMKNDFIGRSRFGKEVKISAPPTVLVSAIARVPDVKFTIDSAFRQAGDYIFILGANKRDMGGSEFADFLDLSNVDISMEPVPVNGPAQLALYRLLFSAIRSGYIHSCHDCSEGGLLVALAESAMGGELGVRTDLDKQVEDIKAFGGSLTEFFYNESPGRFVVSVPEKHLSAFLGHFAGFPLMPFGRVHNEPIIRIMRFGLVLLDAPLEKMGLAWRGVK